MDNVRRYIQTDRERSEIRESVIEIVTEILIKTGRNIKELKLRNGSKEYQVYRKQRERKQKQ